MEDNINKTHSVDIKGSDFNTREFMDMFEEAEEASIDSRASAEQCRDYYDHKQLTEKERAILEQRGQPPVIMNLIRSKINFLLGYEIESQSDPKAFPRTPQDEDAAEAATDALRYVEEKENFDTKASAVWDNMLVEGVGGVEVLVKEVGKRREVTINRWRWDRLFWDPHSVEHDFSDAEYRGGVVWMDERRAKAMYGDDKKKVIEDAVQSAPDSSLDDTFDDVPHFKTWATKGKRNRIRVIQIYYRKDNDWHWAHFCAGGLLDGGKKVIFLNEDDESECPLVMHSAYVDREGNRYGEVKAMIDPQDEANKRRSKLLHLSMSTLTTGERGAVSNVRRMKTEKAKADGHIEINPGKLFDFVDQGQQIAAQAELLRHSEERMTMMGPNAAMQGKGEEAASGRAIQANQTGGLIEMNPLMNQHRNFKVNVYKQVWNRVRQFWDEERWVRVTDKEDNVRFVGFNRELTFGDMMLKQAKQQGIKGAKLKQLEQAIAQDPQSQQPTGVKENVPADMDMDIIIRDAPDTITIQGEQFDQIIDLARVGVQFPPNVYIRMSSLRNKDELLEEMQNGGEEQEPPSEEEMQAMRDAAELQKRQAVAEIEDTEASASKKRAEALAKATDAHLARTAPVTQNII